MRARNVMPTVKIGNKSRNIRKLGTANYLISIRTLFRVCGNGFHHFSCPDIPNIASYIFCCQLINFTTIDCINMYARVRSLIIIYNLQFARAAKVRTTRFDEVKYVCSRYQSSPPVRPLFCRKLSRDETQSADQSKS